ncbi:hypothetical protein [Pseudooceanicola sp. 200-1SW]|uniref:hypothetical protein n=1 Tax=Pseudooceanicola sp. 200-1SW TaxID=3425949 RepID=UPI003D7F2A17
MSLFLLGLALAYLSLGQVFWRKIVMRPWTPEDRVRAGSETAFLDDVAARAPLEIGEKQQWASYYIVKGSFVLFWPGFLLFGFLAGRMFGK